MQQYSPGDRIGGEYTVDKVFGGESESGMGVVYLVHNREIPIPIVLKTFQDAVSADTKHRFISEAHAWIKAGAHTNIVQAYWVREIAGQIFVAAEYVAPDQEGRNNLTHYLSTGPIATEIILLWASQFCHGMDYARSRGVLAHRDIKPDNLMIDTVAGLKITDFGLAKSIDLDASIPSHRWRLFGKKQVAETDSKTKTGSAMGTLPYMAPEQFHNAKAVDHRADIYSFGVILYQMMTGNGYPYRINPDSTEIGSEFFRAHTAQAPSLVDSPVMPIIARCLQKTPERRYATYDALLADLGVVAKQLHIRLPRAVQVANEDDELYAQAQSYVALGDKDRALKAINEYVSKYADRECGWTEKGRIHAERGEFSQGLAATKQSLEINPHNTHAWNNLGILLEKTNAPLTQIKEAFAQALHLDPHNTATMMNLIGPLVQHEEYAEAAALVAKAITLRPDKPLVLAKAQALLGEFMESRQIGAAKTLLAGWSAARPSDVDSWHNFGLMSLEQGDLDQAIACFKHVQRLSPEDSFAVAQLAKLYFQKEKIRECLDCCNKLLQRGYEPLLAVSLKARVLNLIGGYQQALEFLQPYIDHNPSNDALWMALAEVEEYRENYAAAIKALHNAKRVLEKGDGQHDPDKLQFIEKRLRQISKPR